MFEKFIENNDHNKIDDEILATAYENMGDYQRSFIKTAIAFQFTQHKAPLLGQFFLESSNNGFEHYYCNQQEKNLLFYIDKTYSYPTKFLALLCQAIIAKVENIFVFLDKEITEQKKAIFLTCLELAGIENSYFAPQNFYQELQNIAGNGTKILYCTKQTLPFHKNIFLDNSPLSIIAPVQYKQEIELAYAKEDIIFKEEEPYKAIHIQNKKQQNVIADISFCASDTGLQNYSHGMEFCFLYPNLHSDFFTKKIQYHTLKIDFE